MSEKEIQERTYNAIVEIKEYLAANSVRIETAEKRLNSHADNIKELEAYKNKAIGIIAILGLFCGLIGALISKVLNIH